MSPRRVRATRIKRMWRAASDNQTARIIKNWSPIVGLIISSFAIRQSKEAKEDTETTAQSMAVLVQDDTERERHHLADDRRLLRLEKEVRLLKAELGLGRRAKIERGSVGRNQERQPAAHAESGVLRRAWNWLLGG